MAHNLSFVNNQAGDFVSKNVKPWHGGPNKKNQCLMDLVQSITLYKT
jgi:hypothetical protein